MLSIKIKKWMKINTPFLITLILIILNPKRAKKYFFQLLNNILKNKFAKKIALKILNIVDPKSNYLLKIFHPNVVYHKYALQCDHSLLPTAVNGYNEFTLSTDRPKLALICRPGTSHFLRTGLSSLAKFYEIVYFPSFEKNDIEKLRDVDVIFLEWGSTLPILGLLDNATLRKTIVRIHDYEIDSTEYMRPALLKRCHNIIFINRGLRKRFLDKYMGYVKESSCHFVPNIVTPALKLQTKTERKEKSILFIMIQYSERKRLDRCLRIFESILQEDPEFTLTIHSGFNKPIADLERLSPEVRSKIRISIGDLSNNEKDAWKISNKADIQQLYECHDFIVSTSDREGFHYAIAEGMTNGCFPIVWNWDIGDPKQFWEPWVVDTEEDFSQTILEFSKLSAEKKDAIRKSLNEFVITEYGPDAFTKKLQAIISSFSDVSQNAVARRPRIAFFAHNHLVKYNPRGGEKSSMMIVKHLIDNGFDVIVVSRGKPNTEPEKIFEDGILHINIPHLDFPLGAFECLTWIQPDLILTWELAAKMSSDICYAHSIPYMLFVRFWHIVQPPPYVNLLEQELDQDFIKEHKSIFNHAARIISNSNHTAAVVQRIYNVVSDVSYVPVRKPTRAVQGRSKEAPVLVINPGKTMGFEKTLDELIASATDIKFRVVQGEVSKTRKNLMKQPYFDGEYEDLFDGVSMLLFPFSQEPCGTGRVVFEAYNLGIPVIATKTAGIPEVLDTNCLIEKDAKAEHWHQRIIKVLDNYDEYCEKAEALAKKFDVENELNTILKNVDDLVLRD